MAASYSRTSGETVAGGPYTISATLTPSAVLGNYNIAYGAAAFTITKAASVATLQTSASSVMRLSNLTLTAKVTSANGAPTGTVNFADGSTVLGSGVLDATGTVTLTVNTLAAGNHTLVATYAGDSNFNGINSAAARETVEDIQLTGPGTTTTVPPATVDPGGTANYGVLLSPTNGPTFPAAVTFSLSGLPAGATYTITPSSLAAGSGPQTITVRVRIAGLSASLHRHSGGSPLFALGLLLPVFGILCLRTGAGGKRRFAVATCALVVVLMLDMSACGGGSGFLNRVPQSYTMQLTATSGALQQSTNLTLTVQ